MQFGWSTSSEILEWPPNPLRLTSTSQQTLRSSRQHWKCSSGSIVFTPFLLPLPSTGHSTLAFMIWSTRCARTASGLQSIAGIADWPTKSPGIAPRNCVNTYYLHSDHADSDRFLNNLQPNEEEDSPSKGSCIFTTKSPYLFCFGQSVLKNVPEEGGLFLSEYQPKRL